MAKTMEARVQASKEQLKGLGDGGSELSDEQRQKRREAKKQLKRAQRSMSVGKTLAAKKDDMEARRQKNIETAKEKEAKKQQSKETALAEAAEKQVKEAASAESAEGEPE